MIGWLRRLGWGCFRHVWLPGIWTGHDWLHVCEQGCVMYHDEESRCQRSHHDIIGDRP